MKCPLCGRTGDSFYFEEHHLIPGNRKSSDTITVCQQCGDQLHLLYSNYELKKVLNNINNILNDERWRKYKQWVEKKPIESHFTMKKKKRKL